jgi:hypothetical protein
MSYLTSLTIHDLTVDRSPGHLFVTEHEQNRVQVRMQTDEMLLITYLSVPEPTGLALSTDSSQLFVIGREFGGVLVQTFDSVDLQCLRSWMPAKQVNRNRFNAWPWGNKPDLYRIAVRPNGEVLIVVKDTIAIFSKEGELLSNQNLRPQPRYRTGKPLYSEVYQVSICCCLDGRVLLGDHSNEVVVIIS